MQQEERRYVKAQLLGYTLLYLKWLPTETVEADQVFIISYRIQNYETKYNLRKFANEFLAPKKEIKALILHTEFKEFTDIDQQDYYKYIIKSKKEEIDELLS